MFSTAIASSSSSSGEEPVGNRSRANTGDSSQSSQGGDSASRRRRSHRPRGCRGGRKNRKRQQQQQQQQSELRKQRSGNSETSMPMSVSCFPTERRQGLPSDPRVSAEKMPMSSKHSGKVESGSGAQAILPPPPPPSTASEAPTVLKGPNPYALTLTTAQKSNLHNGLVSSGFVLSENLSTLNNMKANMKNAIAIATGSESTMQPMKTLSNVPFTHTNFNYYEGMKTGIQNAPGPKANNVMIKSVNPIEASTTNNVAAGDSLFVISPRSFLTGTKKSYAEVFF